MPTKIGSRQLRALAHLASKKTVASTSDLYDDLVSAGYAKKLGLITTPGAVQPRSTMSLRPGYRITDKGVERAATLNEDGTEKNIGPLSRDNYRLFAQRAIEAYERKGMLVDALLWSGIIGHYEAAVVAHALPSPKMGVAIQALRAWHGDLIVHGKNWRDRAKSSNALKEAADALFSKEPAKELPSMADEGNIDDAGVEP